MIKRGKYIFLIMFAFTIMLFPAVEIPVAKTFHKIKPEKTKTGYGILYALMSKCCEKKTVKIIINKNGCKIAHKAPSTVCLYLIFISLRVKK